MGTNLPEQNMLDQTLNAFLDGGNSAITPAQALPLVEGWLQALRGDPNVDDINQSLTALSDQLRATQPDADRIRDLLTGMAARAAEVAQGPFAEGTWTGKLERMAKLLTEFSQQL